MNRKQEGSRPDEVRGDPEQRSSLATGFEDQPEVAVFEVPETSVNEAGTTGTGTRAEIALLDKRSAEPAHGSVARDSGPGRAAANDEKVQGLAGHPFESAGASAVGKRSVHSVSAASGRSITSTWFQWHAGLIGSGVRVLDIACGEGCHAIAAAQRGANVTALEADPDRLQEAERAARKANVTLELLQLDLVRDPLPAGPFDLVMQFDYLDRARLPVFLEAVKPGGYFEAEMFLEQQRELGWGPTSDEHLLKPGELWSLVGDYEIVLAREVLETLDGRAKAVASILARRPPQ
jgi:SAM-dependent methyltransferase